MQRIVRIDRMKPHLVQSPYFHSTMEQPLTISKVYNSIKLI